ncbi:MAG TPA: peptidylprolyl isomerase [Candidatus Limnocylindrales bacterium]|nr:peptidylprolyl isomerase [Candidatus Limnocylindrales bacterium]
MSHPNHRMSLPCVAAATALLLVPALGCTKSEHSGATVSGDSTAPPAKEAPVAAGASDSKAMLIPAHIQVQHILIGFAGSVPGKNITRTVDEAKTLAYQILARAKAGEDFNALVKQYTDDQPPGIYSMSGSGIPPAPGEFSRDQMVPAFGNVGFAINVGEIGIADYDATKSPYGWHVIKRLR